MNLGIVENDRPAESPEYVRVSLAAAMTMGFVSGWFFRNARLGCINLLLTYADGCKANCAFCGLAGEKNKDPKVRRFIRVPWKTYAVPQIIDAIKNAPPHVQRVCISMITHPRSNRDAIDLCSQITQQTGKPVSLLISPTLLKKDDLLAMKEAGADRVGVAIDAATPELFHKLRGKPVNGPHRWDHYWKIYEDCIEIFGQNMAGVHLICGLGETERQLAACINRARIMGGSTHLFSFFPERGSLMQDDNPPPMGTYRRIQLTRWLVDQDLTRIEAMTFDEGDRIVRFGVSQSTLEEVIGGGEPFRTSGCPGADGKVACNRPYGNEKPGSEIRNFPFSPDEDDLAKIKLQLAEY